MEVFLADWGEYEDHICDVVLPSLNARCVVLADHLGAAPDVKKIEKYQFKLFAMLLSSFEEVLFLDADAFPLMKPEDMFTSERLNQGQW
ncbi:Alpha-1,2-mannosyltransferase [Aspergillus sp. HF37]|nr:Alpha-1,2-mannosyltransferase [Aspergillus sp. HF37]